MLCKDSFCLMYWQFFFLLQHCFVLALKVVIIGFEHLCKMLISRTVLVIVLCGTTSQLVV
jgi:hypothetical protein